MRTKSKYDRFPIVKRGYEPQAVESHIENLAAEADVVLDEAAAQIAALENALEEATKHEEAVHLTILAATKTKEDMLEVAQRQADELRAAGRKDGDRVITDARMQAFQLVTEAKAEAEAFVAEARAESAALHRAEAELSVDTGPSDREVALQRRIEEMQAVIEAMETEIRSHYTATEPSKSTPDTEPQEAPVTDDADSIQESPPTDSAPEPVDPVPAPDDFGRDDHIEIIVTDTADHAPIVEELADDHASVPVDGATAETDASQDDDAQASTVRRSFYSRRSAKLPRIGVEAGRGAMAAAAGLRTSGNGASPDDSSASESTPEYEAV